MKNSGLLKNKTLIIGCGRLGSSIANKDSSSGKNVMIMDSDPMSFENYPRDLVVIHLLEMPLICLFSKKHT